MYIIVTDKPGEYRSEPGDGITAVEAWNYVFYGRIRATYTVCEVRDRQARVAVIDADDETRVNPVPVKFFGSFADIPAARAEIESLVCFGSLDARIEPADVN